MKSSSSDELNVPPQGSDDLNEQHVGSGLRMSWACAAVAVPISVWHVGCATRPAFRAPGAHAAKKAR
jgi:hypothetical protein